MKLVADRVSAQGCGATRSTPADVPVTTYCAAHGAARRRHPRVLLEA